MTDVKPSNAEEKKAGKGTMSGGVLSPVQFTLVFLSIMVVILLVAYVANMG